MIDAVSDAVQAGWDAPRIVTDEVEEVDLPGGSADEESRNGAILDYRVLGYPGGAIIVVVLDGADLMQTSVAVTGLARHLTTWSPGLLEYSPDEVEISKIDKPYDDENWLPPLQPDEDDAERPRWPLAELLDDEIQELGAQYLLACAVRSLWHPTDSTHGDRAWDVVAGSVEQPWGSHLSQALGLLLIRAARFENQLGTRTELIVQGSGTRELAADLLRRARETGTESETDGWTDDDMRGHLLLEEFMVEHELLWNRIPDDEPAGDDRGNRRLRALLWAGLRALATMGAPLARLSGPWQVLSQLGDETIVSILAAEEEEQDRETTEEDLAEVEAAAAAHVLIWLAIRHPELLDASAGALVRHVIRNDSSFHQVVGAAMTMAGSGPLAAALGEMRAPPQIRSSVDDFAAALAATEHADADIRAALELILAEGPELDERIRYMLAVTGLAGNVPTSRTLTHHLLADPAMHAAVVLHRDDDDAAIRTRMLSMAAQITPVAAGDLAAEFPELAGDDPRLEPAARARAVRWIENALRLARERGHQFSDLGFSAESDLGADAQALAAAVTAGSGLPGHWPVHRFVSAGAEAAASILHVINATDLAQDVFADS